PPRRQLALQASARRSRLGVCSAEIREVVGESELLAAVRRRDAQRDVELVVVALDLGQVDDTGAALDVSVELIGVEDLLGMLGFEGVLVASALEQVFTVDEEHLALLVWLLLLSKDQHTGGEARAVEEVGGQPDDRVDEV